jgi:ubiquitin C-terminal hydrolase
MDEQAFTTKIRCFLPIDVPDEKVTEIVKIAMILESSIYNNMIQHIFPHICKADPRLEKWLYRFPMYHSIFSQHCYKMISINILDKAHAIMVNPDFSNDSIKSRINILISNIYNNKVNNLNDATYVMLREYLNIILTFVDRIDTGLHLGQYQLVTSAIQRLVYNTFNANHFLSINGHTHADKENIIAKELCSMECINFNLKYDKHFSRHLDSKKSVINVLKTCFEDIDQLSLCDPTINKFIQAIIDVKHIEICAAYYKFMENLFPSADKNQLLLIRRKYFIDYYSGTDLLVIEKRISNWLYVNQLRTILLIKKHIPSEQKNKKNIIDKVLGELNLSPLVVVHDMSRLYEVTKKFCAAENIDKTSQVKAYNHLQDQYTIAKTAKQNYSGFAPGASAQRTNAWDNKGPSMIHHRAPVVTNHTSTYNYNADYWKKDREERELKAAEYKKEQDEKKKKATEEREALGLLTEGLCSFQNIGNTCFMNSVLQCLNSTPRFVSRIETVNQQHLFYNLVYEFFRDAYPKEKIVEEYFKMINDSNRFEFHKFVRYIKESSISAPLKDIYRTMWENKCKIIVPQTFKRNLGNVNDIYAGFNQHDSCELLTTILNRLHDENRYIQVDELTISNSNPTCVQPLNPGEQSYFDWEKTVVLDTPEDKNVYVMTRESNIDIIISGEYKNYMNNFTVNNGTSFVTEDITGTFILQTHCDGCGNVTSRFESFSILPLEIDDTTPDIVDCLKKFNIVESMTGDNKYSCDICKQLCDASRKTQIWRLPNILVIQFKRFCYVDDKPIKKSNKITFPLDNLTLDTIMYNTEIISNPDLNITYNLTGINCHMGGCNAGHYTSLCKNSKNNEWYNFDDSNMRRIPSDDMKIKMFDNAYVLFYNKNGLDVPHDEIVECSELKVIMDYQVPVTPVYPQHVNHHNYNHHNDNHKNTEIIPYAATEHNYNSNTESFKNIDHDPNHYHMF